MCIIYKTHGLIFGGGLIIGRILSFKNGLAFIWEGLFSRRFIIGRLPYV